MERIETKYILEPYFIEFKDNGGIFQTMNEYEVGRKLYVRKDNQVIEIGIINKLVGEEQLKTFVFTYTGNIYLEAFENEHIVDQHLFGDVEKVDMTDFDPFEAIKNNNNDKVEKVVVESIDIKKLQEELVIEKEKTQVDPNDLPFPEIEIKKRKREKEKDE